MIYIVIPKTTPANKPAITARYQEEFKIKDEIKRLLCRPHGAGERLWMSTGKQKLRLQGGYRRQALINVLHATLDNWTDLVFVRPSCFTSQQCAKLIAKRLQLTNLVVDFTYVLPS